MVSDLLILYHDTFLLVIENTESRLVFISIGYTGIDRADDSQIHGMALALEFGAFFCCRRVLWHRLHRIKIRHFKGDKKYRLSVVYAGHISCILDHRGQNQWAGEHGQDAIWKLTAVLPGRLFRHRPYHTTVPDDS